MVGDQLSLKPKQSLLPETSPKASLGASEENYKRIAEKLAFIVKEISDLSVPDKTIEDWKILSSSVCVVDYKIDKIASQAERLELIDKIVDFLNGNNVSFSSDKDLERAMTDVRNLSSSLSEDQRRLFIDSLLRILKVTEKIKVEKNPKKLVDLTRLEGQINARIFLPFLSEEFRASAKYQKLVHALTRLGRAANGLDSFIDFGNDYNNKQTLIRPSVSNRALFLSGILFDGLEVLKSTGLSKELIKTFLKSIKRVAGEAAK